ncbi:Spectrin beta chain, non-erythrocytic 1, partial [Cichlidogyrus casuarinus]
VEKPKRFNDKGLIEEMLFLTQSKIRAYNHNPYAPPQGKMIEDINEAWKRLESEEHAREIALRDEIIHQERIESFAAGFDRKAGMREQWLTDNLKLVTKDNFGSDLVSVEGSVKKHEAIENDIFAYSERVDAIRRMASYLEQEKYNECDRVNSRCEQIFLLWKELQNLIVRRRARLNESLELHKLFNEMGVRMDSIRKIEARLKSEELGKHLMGVEDLLQKHSLTEADIRVLGTSIEMVINDSQRFIDEDLSSEIGDYRPAEPQEVRRRCEELQQQFATLNQLADERKNKLEDARKMWQFFAEMDDEKEWVKEKNQLMCSPDIGRDLSSVERLQRKHRVLNEECQGREVLFKKKLAEGQALINAGNVGQDMIRQRMQEMNELWEQLIDRLSERKHHLNESQEVFQLLADCDDADAFLSEQDRIVTNDDVGTKLAVTEFLIKNNKEVQTTLGNFKDTVNQLNATGVKVSDYSVSDANTISSRLDALNRHFAKVQENANNREARLKNALSMYKLFDESDTVRTWITEKEKLLTTLVPGDDISEMEVVRHRFECFEKEMASNAAKVGSVNELSTSVLSSDHPDSAQIQHHQDNLNSTWNQLADLVEERKKSLETAYRYNQFLTEATETGNWIQDKAKLVESTDELGNDLEGIMQLQRKLGGLQRDLQVPFSLESLELEKG